MINLIRAFRNKINMLKAAIGSSLFPHKGKDLGWLLRNQIKLDDDLFTFSYRRSSEGDNGVIHQIFHEREYSVKQWKQGEAVINWYKAKAKVNKLLIIDAGANIGASAVFFSVIYPGCKVYAVEPEKNNCILARMNCSGRDIEIFEGAIGSEQGQLYLQDPGESDWGFRTGSSGEYSVPVITINQILSESSLNTTPFILKMDIEGAEENVFRGDCDWIDLFPLIILETHDWMLPGLGNSRGFYQQVSSRNFDIIQNGENTFCFNNNLLKGYYNNKMK